MASFETYQAQAILKVLLKSGLLPSLAKESTVSKFKVNPIHSFYEKL